ncbi:MAG TPA: hypothetical protein VKA87_07395 [Nitrososphaeraceae archaeon]|nr:hypothetical protein [Nitrososphaeraceae archaeon]
MSLSRVKTRTGNQQHQKVDRTGCGVGTVPDLYLYDLYARPENHMDA